MKHFKEGQLFVNYETAGWLGQNTQNLEIAYIICDSVIITGCLFMTTPKLYLCHDDVPDADWLWSECVATPLDVSIASRSV
jgi:hypothetical protein